MTLDEQIERAVVGVFVRRLDERARAIRIEVGTSRDGDAALRLRAADSLADMAADIAALLPPDPPGTVTILPPGSAPQLAPTGAE